MAVRSLSHVIHGIPGSWGIGLAGGLTPLGVALAIMAINFVLPFLIFPTPVEYVFGGALIAAVALLDGPRLRGAAVAALIGLFLSVMLWYAVIAVYYSFYAFPG